MESSEAIIDLEVFTKVEENGESRSRKKKKMMMKVWMLVLVLGISAIGFGNGQEVPPCLAPLSPCINFLNSTNPPQTCCNPIKEMNATQNSCFCQLALTPGALEALGTTIPQALQLVQSCGVNFKITSCKGYLQSLITAF